MVMAVVMINIQATGRGGGAPRGFDSRHDCSGKAGYGHAGGRGDDSFSKMAMTMTAVVGR